MQVLLVMAFCKKPSPRVYDPSHSALYLCSGTLSQNEVGILLKWGRGGTAKSSKFGKKHVQREVFVR